MKKIFNIFGLFVFITLQHANGATVVGSVNGNPITDSDITARTELMARQGKTSKTNPLTAISPVEVTIVSFI